MPSPTSIAAIATPQAPSALGLIRCSGPLSSGVFTNLTPRRASLTKYLSKEGVLLDTVVATYYEEGHSYTGETMLELSCHGNPFIFKKILSDLIARGFVLAEPGEFTKRAFLNGKLDLTQAEAIGNLIAAHSDRALATAHRQLAGDLGKMIIGFADELLQLIAQVEAQIDFPEEGLPTDIPIENTLVELRMKLMMLSSTHRAHTLTFSGTKVALVGAPNVGKSSLFNTLIGHDRAIVSPEAGTTRDYIEADLSLGGHAVRLIDTAGLNVEPSEIEAMGIAKTHDQLATADIVIAVIDGTDHSLVPADVGSQTRPFATLVAVTKADLPNFAIPEFSQQTTLGYLIPQTPTVIPVSAVSGKGLDDLRAELVKALNSLMPSADTLMVSSRHALALDEALKQIEEALVLLQKQSDPALIAHHLRCALNYLGEILGKFDNEQVLDKLFKQFCIGK